MKKLNKGKVFLASLIMIIVIVVTGIMITNRPKENIMPEENTTMVENIINEEPIVEEQKISTEVMYTTTGVNMRTAPDLKAEIFKVLYINTEVNKICEEGDWTKILYEDEIYYIHSNYLSKEKTKIEVPKKTTVTSRGGSTTTTSAANSNLLGTYKITYYCACVKCCGKTNGITASGAKAQAGVTIAAPKNFAFGTKLLINGQVYTVQDRGGAINGNRLDIFVGSHQEALNKGVTYAEVYRVE